MRGLQDNIKPLLALRPIKLSGDGAAVSGVVIDRRGYEAALFSCSIGDVEGTPTRLGVAFKMQHCATSTGSFADFSGATTSISGDGTALQGEFSHIDVNLIGAERYIKLVATPQFTGGSSPKVLVGADCVLAEAKVVPAV